MSSIEAFAAWRLAGGPDPLALAAKRAEAFFVLNNEMRLEENDERDR